jgi:hypothetical protein
VFAASRDDCILALRTIGVEPGEWATDDEFRTQVVREYIMRRRRLILSVTQENPGAGTDVPRLHEILEFVYDRIPGMSLVSSIVSTTILLLIFHSLVHMIFSFRVIQKFKLEHINLQK